MKPISVGLFSFLLGHTVAQQFTDDDDLSWGSYGEDVFTPECRAALNTTLDCSWMLGEYITHELGEVTNENLDEICTPQCFGSLPKVQKFIHQACPRDDNWVELQNKDIDFASDIIDDIARGHQEACFRDRDTDELCLSVMRNWTWEYEAKHSCANCLIGLKELYLNSTEEFDQGAYDEFTSLTKSCSKTGFYPPTPPPVNDPSPTETATSSTPTQSCASTYTIQENDTCNGICKKLNVSTDALTWLNQIASYCEQLPQPGTKLCVPERCGIYTVGKNDTCYSVVKKAPSYITVTQLLAWNLNLNSLCSNMVQQEGMQICDGMKKNCNKFYKVKDGDYCEKICKEDGISIKDFTAWNPDVKADCSLLQKDYYYYCVG
ncbi:hypothetical protein FGRMN_9939 [Fusarium graminum]|nr:hypothetical protein FGRMN_9939 [Fusarium graminum]